MKTIKIIFIMLLLMVSSVSALTIFYPIDDDIVIGSLAQGNINDLKILDESSISYYHINGSSNTLDVRLLFGSDSQTSNFLYTNTRISAQGNRRVNLEVFDVDDGWVYLEEFSPSSNYKFRKFDISSINLEDEPRIRFRNYDIGDDDDELLLDYVAMSSDIIEDIEDDNMFIIEFTTGNVIMLMVILVLSILMMMVNILPVIISGNILAVLISTIIMFSFNPFIGLLILIGSISFFLNQVNNIG